MGVIVPIDDIDKTLDWDAVGVTVVEDVLVFLILTDEEPDAVIVFELVVVAVVVIVLGAVNVILIEAVPDTETVDVLLDDGDLVVVIVLTELGETKAVADVVFDIFAVAVVVGVKVDVFDPTVECVVLGDPDDVLDDVTVPVLVVVIIVVFVGLTEEEIEADPEEDLEAVTDFVLVGLPEEVFVKGGVLL